jgi:hypothetical protein
MTLRFQLEFGNENMDVSVDRDGVIVFNDRDMDYEVAFSAMSGGKSMAMVLLERWQDSRWSVLNRLLHEDHAFLCRMLADYVERVLPVYCSYSSFKDDRCPTIALETSRMILDGMAVSRSHATRVLNEVRASKDKAGELFDMVQPAFDVAVAAFTLIRAAIYTKWHDRSFIGSMYTLISGGLMDCQHAMVFAGPDHGLKHRKEALVVEEAWQWHRVYDAKVALDAGKPWPPMEATP